MKERYGLNLLVVLAVSCVAHGETYETTFDFADQKLACGLRSGQLSVLAPATVLLVDQYFAPSDWTCDIHGGNLVMSDPTQSAQNDNGLLGVQATTLPPVFKTGVGVEVTIDKTTVESIRDGALPEGLFAGLCVWDYARNALTFFGVVRRPEAQDGYDWWHDNGGLEINELSERHRGYYVALSVSHNPLHTRVHGVKTIPSGLNTDIVLLADVDDKGKLSLGINDAQFVPSVTIPQPGGVALSVFNTGGATALPSWSGVTFKRFRATGDEVAEGPLPLEATKDAQAVEPKSTVTCSPDEKTAK